MIKPAHAPLFWPTCRSCAQPVERMVMPEYWGDSDFVQVEASCHGVTSGIRVRLGDILRSQLTGEKIWLFIPKVKRKRLAGSPVLR